MNDIGELGEKIAASFLLSRKFLIVHKNFRTPFGEIDIIAERDGYTVFFEIKTRISEKYGVPFSAIDAKKQEHIIKNSLYYLVGRNLMDSPCRIDAISINLDLGGKFLILKHVKNAINTNNINRRR